MAMTFPSNPTTGQQYSVSGGPTYTWDGTVWKILTPGSQFSEQQFTATAGQTSFTVSGGYVIGAVDVYRNGVKLVVGVDFLATDLSTVTLVNAAAAGDTIEVVKAAQILYADALKATNNLSDVGNAATALSNLGGLPKAGGTMTGLLNLGSVGQIQFPATQNASSDANTLDDYEEGTWTPNLSSNNGNGTFTTKSGTYTKIGRLVTITFMVDAGNSLASGTTQYVAGLPFPCYSSYSANMIVGQLGSNGPAIRTQQILTNSANRSVLYIYSGGSQETTTISYASGTATYLTDN